MLELREYTKSELSSILGTSDRQGIRRKLERYNIDFDESGHSNNAVFEIKNFERPFKVFCIIDLGVPAQVDFDKMRDYLYYLSTMMVLPICLRLSEDKYFHQMV